MLKRVRIAFVCVLMLAPGALAHASAAQEPDAHLQQAREVVELMGAEQLYRDMITVTMPLLEPSFRQSWPGVSDKAIQQAMDLLGSALIGAAPGFMDETAALYRRSFTQAELEALADFLRSPAGARFIALQPQIMQEGQAIGERIGERISIELLPQLQAIIESD
ncbi:MAG: DUF2059 domain-containing protein [Alphaproteobacteria bacterium]|nr:DUF2059 domain-containing protein [Alphaproteobacteria bacterium]